MALHKLKDFAALCGRKLSAVSMDKSRNKLIADAKGNIDTDNQVNAAYLAIWQAKKGKVTVTAPAAPPVTAETFAYSKTHKPKGKPVPPEVPDDGDDETLSPDSLVKLAIQKEKGIIAHTLVKIDIDKLRREKLLGQQIPTALVNDLVTQIYASITTSYAQFSENLLNEIGKDKDFTLEEIAENRLKLRNGLNQASADATEMTRVNLQNIVTEFSQKRKPGEKK